MPKVIGPEERLRVPNASIEDRLSDWPLAGASNFGTVVEGATFREAIRNFVEATGCPLVHDPHDPGVLRHGRDKEVVVCHAAIVGPSGEHVAVRSLDQRLDPDEVVVIEPLFC